jgi:hypothetical protein
MARNVLKEGDEGLSSNVDRKTRNIQLSSQP